MTTALHRRSESPAGATRWTCAVIIALVAAFAVLVHHDAPSTTPSGSASTTSGMSGMSHTSTGMTSATMVMDDEAPRVAAPPMDGDHSGCSGLITGHCSSASINTWQLVPPPAAPFAAPTDGLCGDFAGHVPPGTAPRAPPDLSVLSRLLI
ncbi:hypothetical protein [Streptomyces sp. NPDC046984]|uniref:hypothetical protein n=1 Tax=unclassified Streptomyces TaxID=2593676 RepID=UPI0033D234D1